MLASSWCVLVDRHRWVPGAFEHRAQGSRAPSPTLPRRARTTCSSSPRWPPTPMGRRACTGSWARPPPACSELAGHVRARPRPSSATSATSRPTPRRRPRPGPLHHRRDAVVRGAEGRPSTTSWRNGGLRILGVHSATDANHGWPEYGSMLGARFDGHPWTQDFVIDVVDADHPATAHLGAPQWQWQRRGLPLRRPASRRPRPAPPRRGPGRPGRARAGGCPTAASPSPGACEDGPRPHLLQRARPLPRGLGDAGLPAPPGRGPRLAGRRPPNLTCMSGSSLPEVMAAAVYQSPGVITVEERTVPRPGPDQIVVRVHSCGICGSDIHQLRDGWGFTPGAVAGHEWSGTIAAVGDDVTEWSVGELVVGRPRPAMRHLPSLPGGQALAVREPQQHDAASSPTAPSPSTSSAGPAASCASPRASSPATPRWPSRCRWRCTASPARASRPATASWSSAPARSAR